MGTNRSKSEKLVTEPRSQLSAKFPLSRRPPRAGATQCSGCPQDLGGGGSGDSVRPLVRSAIGRRNCTTSEMPYAFVFCETMAPCTDAHAAEHALPDEQVP